jgi:site-specific DNA-methyltransferase (adenine-specific)
MSAPTWSNRIVGHADVPPDQLLANPENWRKHPTFQRKALAGVLSDVGVVQSVIVNKRTGRLVDGHLRVELALEQGQPTVPVVYVDLSEADELKILATIDPVSGLAETDREALASVLAQVETDDPGLQALLIHLGKDPASGLLDGVDPDAVPDVPGPVETVEGELIILGRHRLFCGDSTRADHVAALLGDAIPRLMVIDPPYGVKYDPAWRQRAGVGSAGAATGKVMNDDRADWSETWALFPGAVAYVWHGGLHAGTVQASLLKSGFEVRAQIIWAKTRHALSRGHYHWQHEPCLYAVREGEEDGWRYIPEHEAVAYAVRTGETANWAGGRRQSTLWTIEHLKSDTGHGTQKPLDCMRRPILNNSAPGDSVYEPFCGSGTTLIACEATDRSCFAMELDPHYCDVIAQRWANATGGTPQRIKPVDP